MTALDWIQNNIEFPDRATAARVAARELRPALTAAQDSGNLHGWWFVRKQPWRLRYRAADSAPAAITSLLSDLAARGQVISWATVIYEPETMAFGGTEAMAIAHDLFHHDSQHILARAAEVTAPVLGQRETSALLCSVMLRAAGLDWFEQGDTWAKVSALRPAAPGTIPPGRAATLASAMRLLMTIDARPLCDPAANGALAGCAGWVTAFEQAGQALADLARHGHLTRGLRAVLAHHIIFHANRAALTVTEQAALATLATGTVFNSRGTAAPPPANGSATETAPSGGSLSASQLRARMADSLIRQGEIRAQAVEAAIRQVPRHLFIPGVPADRAYADEAVYIKHDRDGTRLSAASRPAVVAAMLEQLAARPGERILEIGAGTGYNAALLAAIVGDSGRITTIDVDADIVTRAREHLAAAGTGNVTVITGDGALGHPPGAPYDRVVATAEAFEIPDQWLSQLAPGGRIVVPLRLRGAISRSIIFERCPCGWRSAGSELTGFIPLRGIAGDARRLIPVTHGKDVTLQVHKDQEADAAALAGVLDTRRCEDWTGVLFPPMVPYEWLELWLSLRLGNALMRMDTQPAATGRGIVTPMFPWGSMATTQEGDLAYLTTRPVTPASGGRLYEVGVIGHGQAGQELAELMTQEVRAWDAAYRSCSARFEMHDTPVSPDPAAGRFVLNRPRRPITVIWE